MARPRRLPAWGLLGVAVVVAAPAWARVRAATEKEYSADIFKKNHIYGNIKREVSVYVKVFTNSPFLVCMDLGLSQEEIIDPSYLWIGPDGKKLKGQIYVNLTEAGKLMVMGFKESMSGAYTCTLSHKLIETDTQDETEVYEAYKFMVYDVGCIAGDKIPCEIECDYTAVLIHKSFQAYREPDYTYRISVRFATKECKLFANERFFKELKKILDNLLSDLACHIIEPSHKCHSVKLPKRSLLHELFITFQVNPFAPGWEEVCNHLPYDCEDETNKRVQKARDRIEEFFNRQANALRHNFRTAPVIHYVEHSFEVTRIDSCRPGFGKNDITHNDCASCCVVCDPGTYSPNNEVTCRTCVRTQIKQYGAKSC